IHDGSHRTRRRDASGRRPVSGSHVVWPFLRDRRHARRHKRVPPKKESGIQGQIANAMAAKLQPGSINDELTASGLRFAIVVIRFNSYITQLLLAAPVDALDPPTAAIDNGDAV